MSRVIDESTGKIISKSKCVLIITDCIKNYIVLGYTSKLNEYYSVLFINKNGCFTPIYTKINPTTSKYFIYSNYFGKYVCVIGVKKNVIYEITHKLGQGDFPYSFSQKYEAIDNFKLFQDKQKVLNNRNCNIAKYCKYTFGLEFETSAGYIPEDICIRDGLIPLRDGSISGIEYSTIILQNNEGFSLLKQQLQTLSKYTIFNKECSLHIHFGGFPLNPEYIYNVYKICFYLQDALARIVPDYTFSSSNYKANEKDYCNFLRSYENFDNFYYALVARDYFGDLTQPHPNDIRREAKWRIPSRYYWVNFINALCYNINKTIEFRFLRPTYNYNKIIFWMYIFNAILVFAENPQEYYNLNTIINKVYPKKLANSLNNCIHKLSICKYNQSINSDFIGNDIFLEKGIFNNIK